MRLPLVNINDETAKKLYKLVADIDDTLAQKKVISEMAITARAIPDQLKGVNFSLNNSIPPKADSIITPIFTTGKT